MNKITIIIPIYNGSRYIQKCVKSIQEQTFAQFELILVNDGSLDASGIICDSIAEKDSRIKVIHQKNLGVSNARNVGINNSTGDYICFIDCDDYINENYLMTLYEACENNNVLISICTTKSIKENKEIISEMKMAEGKYSSKIILQKLFEFKDLNTGPCGKLFHKSLFKSNIQFQNIKIYEDLLFVYKIIYETNDVYFTERCKYNYVHRSNEGAMAKFAQNPTIDVIVAIKEILEFIKLYEPELWKECFYRLIAQVIMYINDINKNDEKWSNKGSKIYINETKKLLFKYKKEILIDKNIIVKEKIIFILLAYSTYIYKKVNILIKKKNNILKFRRKNE